MKNRNKKGKKEIKIRIKKQNIKDTDKMKEKIWMKKD